MSKTEAQTRRNGTQRHNAALKAHRTRATEALRRARNPQRRRELKAQVREYDRRLKA